MEGSDASTIAWIFFAISYWDKSPVTRLEIMHSADALNHLQPLDSELDLALPCLIERELVQDVGGSFAITESGRLFLDHANNGATNVYDAMKALENAIGSPGAV